MVLIYRRLAGFSSSMEWRMAFQLGTMFDTFRYFTGLTGLAGFCRESAMRSMGLLGWILTAALLTGAGCKMQYYDLAERKWVEHEVAFNSDWLDEKDAETPTPAPAPAEAAAAVKPEIEPDVKPAVKPATPTAVTTQADPTEPIPLEKPDFQGWFLQVKLDGHATAHAAHAGPTRLWAGGEVSSTPVLAFTLDAEKLGDLKGTPGLNLYPLKDGKVDWKHFYQYTGQTKFQEGKPVTLNHFTRRNHAHLAQGLTSLRPGPYRLHLKVQGTKGTWDQQYVDIEVK